jgi:hypothetical protein
MTNDKEHPEQDPAEGSRETIERDLARKDRRADKGRRNHAPSHLCAKPPAGTALRRPRNNEA